MADVIPYDMVEDDVGAHIQAPSGVIPYDMVEDDVSQTRDAQFGTAGALASGVLQGAAGIGDFVDLGTKAIKEITYPSRLMQALGIKDPETTNIGGLLRKGFDYATGVKDSTGIGKDTYAYKAGQYLPGMLMGPGKLLSNGVMGTAKNLLKVGATTALTAGGGYAGQKVGEEVGHPVAGEILGSLGAASVPGVVESLAKNTSTGIMDSLLGYSQTGRNRIVGYLDKSGNKVEKASEGVSILGANEESLQKLKDSGFNIDKIGVADTPKSVAHKLSVFKEKAGEKLGTVIDDATELESNFLNSKDISPQEKGAYLVKGDLDLTSARSFADDVHELGNPELAIKFNDKISKIEEAWNKSDQTIADLQAIKQRFGKVNKKGFSSADDKLANDLNDIIYGSLAETVKDKIKTIGGDELAGSFSSANKAYSASSEWLPKAFRASNKGTFSKLKSDFGLGGALPNLLAYGAISHSIPGLNILTGAERLYTALKDVAPVQVAKSAQGVSKVAGAFNSPSAKIAAGLLGLGGGSAIAQTPSENTSENDILKNALSKLNETPLKTDMSTLDTPKQKEEFHAKVKDIADNLDADPEHLLQVMKFETGGTLDSAVKNKAGSGATGLIQFMPSTAKELTGEDTKAAAIKVMESMTPTEQLSYVGKYLAPFKGKLKTLEDMYMAILYPKAVGKDSEYALFKKGTTAYWQNRGLDIDKDGTITKAEAASKVKSYKA